MPLYFVDRAGYCQPGMTLELLRDPPFEMLDLPGFLAESETRAHLQSLFADGLSIHGWHYLLERLSYPQMGSVNFVNYDPSLELAFEHLRRADHASAPSRFQSYFAWESFADATAFSQGAIFELEADDQYRVDQNWLRFGYQVVHTSLCATRYWSQVASPSPKWEILLKPPVRVLRRVR